jgi:hypothetical protein
MDDNEHLVQCRVGLIQAIFREFNETLYKKLVPLLHGGALLPPAGVL